MKRIVLMALLLLAFGIAFSKEGKKITKEDIVSHSTQIQDKENHKKHHKDKKNHYENKYDNATSSATKK